MATSTLYLTQEEIDNIFVKLDPGMQSAWKSALAVETIAAYETEDELRRRMQTIRVDDLPDAKEFAASFAAAAESGDLSGVSLEKLPDTAILRHFYAIGACGLSALLEMTMQQEKLSQEDMQAVADFSVVRHAILEANAAKAAA